MSGSIDLALVLAIVAVAAVYLTRRHLANRKSGKLGCGCGCDTTCGGCGSSSSCNDPHKDTRLT